MASSRLGRSIPVDGFECRSETDTVEAKARGIKDLLLVRGIYRPWR
jgi:hypothetical protein